jgi:hypothetical protein
VALDQGDAQTSGDRVEGNPGPDDSAAYNEDVHGISGGQPIAISGPAGTRESRSG